MSGLWHEQTVSVPTTTQSIRAGFVYIHGMNGTNIRHLIEIDVSQVRIPRLYCTASHFLDHEAAFMALLIINVIIQALNSMHRNSAF